MLRPKNERRRPFERGQRLDCRLAGGRSSYTEKLHRAQCQAVKP